MSDSAMIVAGAIACLGLAGAGSAFGTGFAAAARMDLRLQHAAAEFLRGRRGLVRRRGHLPRGHRSAVPAQQLVPVGGDLEYTDEVTLYKALEGRRDM